MSDTVKIRVGMSVNYIAGSTREDIIDTEIPCAEWDAMTEADREKILNDYAAGGLENSVDAWAYPVEDSDD